MTVTVLPTQRAAEAAYIAQGRAALGALLPSESFDAITWDPKALVKTTAARAQRLYFTEHGSLTMPLCQAFADVVKAWVILGGGTPSRMNARVSAARWLWRGICQRLGPDKATFAWTDLRPMDLQAAEQLMLNEGLEPRVVNKTAGTMADLAREVGRRSIGSPIAFTPATKRVSDSNNHRVDDPEARGANVLSQGALDALADIFHRAESRIDQFYSALLALLIATGIRWNEAVTLPHEPIEDEEVDLPSITNAPVRRIITYLRRHKAKSGRAGGDGRPSFERVPLTDQQAALARLAVQRLQAVCSPARSIAARLEQSAPHWIWPDVFRPEWLRQADIVALLSCSPDYANLLLAEIGEIDPASTSRRPSRRAGIETFQRYMTSRQDWDALWVVKPSGASPGQRASASLLCVRMNELHDGKATLPLIDVPSHSGLEAWLEGRSGSASVFRRFEAKYGVEYREADGSEVVVNSHMCRRLFVTAGLTAGATMLDMMRWQGREHVGDLASYDERSMIEKASMVRGAIKSGRLKGQVAQAYMQMATDVRDVWLEGQVQAMHVTPLGICVHEFNATPCPRALNCLKNCPDYLHDANDAGQRHQLVQLRRRSQEVMVALKPELDAGRIAPSWIEEHQTTVANIDRILATPVEDDGSYVRPFSDGTTRFQPLSKEP